MRRNFRFLLCPFVTVLLCCHSDSFFAQVIADKTYYNFGEVRSEDAKFIDFKLTNASQDNIGISKFELPYGFSVRFSSKTIAPDQTVLVRIKYTPKRKGEFRGDVNIYVTSNSQPIVLTLEGKALTFNVNESLDVPDFESEIRISAVETFSLDINVIRKVDKSPVENARLDVIWDGVMYRNLYSDKEGVARGDFTPDKYYVVVRADSLGTFESELSIHQGIRNFTIELGPEGTISQVTEDSADVYESVIVDTLGLDIGEEKSADEGIFSKDQYKANNIVFLIDISISMKEKGKLNLLKASMIELTDLLRPIDKVAIVTYSTKAVVALNSTSASEKEKIKKVIQGLEARGTTSGQRGMKKAYQVLEDNEIKGGNNQVFISTDGAFDFNKQDKDLISIASKKYETNGYKISVIGIKNVTWTVKNMKQLAEAGHGNYLHITTYDDAKSKLVEEVRLQSKSGSSQ